MAWLEWIRRLFGHKPAGDRQQQTSVCPRCGCRLRSSRARQCLTCGASWHRLDDSAALSSRRRLTDDWYFTPRDAPAPFTPATARLLENSWEPELLPPTSLRAALDLGTLAPPKPTTVRRAKKPHQVDKPQTSKKHAARAASNCETAADGSSSPARPQPSWLYLGRGVSRHLSECTSDTARLAELELPLLHTPDDVAAAIGIEPRRLRWLCWHTAATPRPHYVTFEVSKRSGGTRQLAAPHAQLKQCQAWILRNILDRVPTHDAAHGFVRGRSTLTNAQGHVAQDVVANLDLKDFFPSITLPRVVGIFRSLGYSPAVATVLGLLCTECPRRKVELAGRTWYVATGPRALPQGACTSPMLSNLAARRLDRRLAGLAQRLGWHYSRYADDLTFSTATAADRTAYLLAMARRIAKEEDFEVNETKTRVLRQNASQRVTGVVVNRRAGVPRKLVRRVRAILHQAQQTGLAAQNREDRPDFRRWLEGTVAYIAMINPQQAAPLQQALAQVKAAERAQGVSQSGGVTSS